MEKTHNNKAWFLVLPVLVGSLRYEDEYRRRDGKWYFASRLLNRSRHRFKADPERDD
ncbi:hypothetical protein VB636_00270 [Paracoccus sp. APAP_BH8]|uniref:hypothetical protein n=1 Tax=Paracoccus sp. APAP_BH8 TaxID=3110237 RepID=UPI002FD8457A